MAQTVAQAEPHQVAETSTMATSLVYEGPQARIVELERNVESGDVLLDIDDGIADKLLHSQGLRTAKPSEIKKAKGEEDTPAPEPPAEEEGEGGFGG